LIDAQKKCSQQLDVLKFVNLAGNVKLKHTKKDEVVSSNPFGIGSIDGV